jgi:hypothetical protein
MSKHFAVSTVLAAIACLAFTMAPSASAADLPELQVGTRIVSTDAAPSSGDTVDETATEPTEHETEESAS